jgi:hypothetical protein
MARLYVRKAELNGANLNPPPPIEERRTPVTDIDTTMTDTPDEENDEEEEEEEEEKDDDDDDDMSDPEADYFATLPDHADETPPTTPETEDDDDDISDTVPEDFAYSAEVDGLPAPQSSDKPVVTISKGDESIVTVAELQAGESLSA